MSDLLNRGLITLNDEEGETAAGHQHESTILVTGLARGGTSMLAQVLDRLGLFLGDLRDPVVVEDTEILRALQKSDWERLDGLIADRNKRFATWGFKVPNLQNFLPAKDSRRFRFPRYIVVFRDPLAVASRMGLSTQRDVAESIREAGAAAMRLTSYVCELTEPALLISYEKALRNPEHMVEAMSAFCGLSPSEGQKAAAKATITPDDTNYIWATQTIFRGRVDNIRGSTLRGWCCYRDSPDVVKIEVMAEDRAIGVFPAEEFRSDLKNAGIHDGCNAFNIDLTPFGLDSATTISVRPAGRRLALPNSQLSIEDLRRR